MSYSSRPQPSVRTYADTGHSNLSHLQSPLRKILVDEAHSALSSQPHTLHGGHSHRNVTVTRYRFHTNGESTTSYHDNREYTAYDSHLSSSGYQETWQAPPYSPSFRLNDRDRPSFSDEGHRDPTRRPRDVFHTSEASSQRLGAGYRHSHLDRHHASDYDNMPKECKPKGPQPSAEKKRGYSSYPHAKHSQSEEFGPAYVRGYFSKRGSHDRDTHGKGGHQRQQMPNDGSRGREERHYHSRSTRIKKNDQYYEDCEQSHFRDSKPSQPKSPKPAYTDGHSIRSRSYSNHKYATKDKSGQSKAESGSGRRQEKPHGSKGESRLAGDPENNHQEIAQPKAEENFPDHYATLKVNPFASDTEVKSAARRRRVEVHPDRLKNGGMSESERAEIDAAAAQVGQAADVLQDPEQKREYDRELFAAKGWEWCRK